MCVDNVDKYVDFKVCFFEIEEGICEAQRHNNKR